MTEGASTASWVPTVIGGLMLAAGLVAYGGYIKNKFDRPASSLVRFEDTGDFQPAPPEALPGYPAAGSTAKILFVGDIMQHQRQAIDDFHASYSHIAPLIARADLAVGNLEFPVVPGSPVGPIGRSVRFNGSVEHLDALKGAGFDMLSVANNHVFDQGLAGAESTIRALQERGLQAVGSAIAPALVGPSVRDVNGIRLAFSGYTFRPNAYPGKAGKLQYWSREWPIHELNFDDWTGEYRAKAMAQFHRDVGVARAAGAELMIALVHWGKEWHFQPTEDQRQAAYDMIDAGFDLVVGGHAHVINGPEIYRDRLIAYSLGNFISDFSDLPTRLGGILEVSVDRRGNFERPEIVDFRYYATLVDRDGHRIKPISGVRTAQEDNAWALANRIFGPALQPLELKAGD